MVEIRRLKAKQVLTVAEWFVIPAEETMLKLRIRHLFYRSSFRAWPGIQFFQGIAILDTHVSSTGQASQVRHDGDVDFIQPILGPLVL